MNFVDAGLSSLLDGWTTSSDLRERAEAHNIRFEERLDLVRLDAFERSVKGPCKDYAELRHRVSDYVQTYIEVAFPHVPPTFRAENRSASMRPISPEQKLVRIENITRHLANSGLAANELEKSRLSTRPTVLAMAEMFLDQWNLARDSRPSFAAFKDQLLAEIGDADWPHRLRDRLGLAHFDASGGPVTVALMEYTVEDVLAEVARSPGVAHPFAFPTFLDAKPSAQFFPTPKELPAGAPMALFNIWSDDELVAEVLHSRLTYRRHHIAKLGEISSNGPAVVFKTLRNNHLAALQLAAVRDDFGEAL